MYAAFLADKTVQDRTYTMLRTEFGVMINHLIIRGGALDGLAADEHFKNKAVVQVVIFEVKSSKHPYTVPSKAKSRKGEKVTSDNVMDVADEKHVVKGIGPYEDMWDCDRDRYILQVSYYQWIIEKYYLKGFTYNKREITIEVVDRVIVHVHVQEGKADN